MMLILAAVELITLHLVDGRAAVINPQQVTQMQQPREEGQSGKQLHGSVKCVIRFTDGGYLSVAEDCATVRKLMEGEP